MLNIKTITFYILDECCPTKPLSPVEYAKLVIGFQIIFMKFCYSLYPKNLSESGLTLLALSTEYLVIMTLNAEDLVIITRGSRSC